MLPKGQKGGIYIAGQRFEYDNSYDGLEDMVLFIKEKPPVSVLDPSRDRTSLNKSQLESIADWICSSEKTSTGDKVALLNIFESFWKKTGYFGKTPADNFLETMLTKMKYASETQNLHIKFPSNYVAYSNASDDIVRELEMSGYTVCKDNFHHFGMQDIKELLGEARAHEPVMPTKDEKMKISIIKKALLKLKSLQGKHFTSQEMNSKIYLFDAKGNGENLMYDSTLAEAIIDGGTSKGFWMDRGYLNRAKFGEALETAIHELCHKAGGDESAAFSYKLTKANALATQEIVDNPDTRLYLETLNKLWNKLTLKADTSVAA